MASPSPRRSRRLAGEDSGVVFSRRADDHDPIVDVDPNPTSTQQPSKQEGAITGVVLGVAVSLGVASLLAINYWAPQHNLEQMLACLQKFFGAEVVACALGFLAAYCTTRAANDWGARPLKAKAHRELYEEMGLTNGASSQRIRVRATDKANTPCFNSSNLTDAD